MNKNDNRDMEKVSPPSAQQSVKQAALFGDSIMRGMYWDETLSKYKIWQNGYLEEIKTLGRVEVNNHAQIGCTVERGMQLFDKALAKGLDCDLLLLEYGGNDSDFDWETVAAVSEEPHLPKTPLPRFEQVYTMMIKKGQQLGMKPILMNLPPIDAQKYFAWFSRKLDRDALRRWLGDIGVIYRYQEMYSLVVTKLAKRFSCPLIDLRSAFLPRHQLGPLIGPDGLHPTMAGYSLIWEEIKRVLVKDNTGAMIARK